MKGDFSRIRFTPGQHFTSVLQQQGRVSLDADANEQCAIDEYLRGVQTIDTLGDVGGPRDDAGFRITVEDSSSRIHISGGRYYVHGLLCESSATDYMDQRYLVNSGVTDEDLLKELSGGKIDAICVELQVWQRLVTALDDPCLLEPALNQADTTARLQTVWRVVASPVSTLAERIAVSKVEKPGKLCAKVSNTSDDCSCQPIPPAGYQGLENQLYRIEIHHAGDETTATFKWSRENASIVTAITGSSTNNGQTTILVDSLGKDANLGFAANQWVEISDDTNEFGDTPNRSGELWQIASVSAAGQPPSITFNTIIPAVSLGYNPRVRRWDQPGTATAGDIPISVNTPIDIENGIQVTFTAGKYWSGDYWLIPARTASGTIDWPPCGSDKNCYQPADYIHLYTAPLAFITAPARAARDLAKAEILPLLVEDLRSFFAPLSASAMHIENFSWTNDDLMTLDRLLIDGLQLFFDRAPTSRADAPVFSVSLEIPQLPPEQFQYEGRAVKGTPPPTPPAPPHPSQPAKVAKLPAQASSVVIKPVMLRQEYVLDGIVTLRGQTLIWGLPTEGGNEDYYASLIYQLNNLLQVSYAPDLTWYARVRVRLLGHMIYLQTAGTSGQCGQTKTLFLDGQCFGELGRRSDNSPRVALVRPSGNSAMASDFESWFYLAPMAELTGVTFDAASITVDGSGAGQNTGTVTLAGPVATATTINLSVSPLAVATFTVPATITIDAGSVYQTFTASVQLTAGTPDAVCVVQATPQWAVDLGYLFQASGSFLAYGNWLAISTASLPNGTYNTAYSTTLSATGGTPPYSWRIPSGKLPDNLILDATSGTISGTALTAGTLTFTVEVSDSETPSATATKQFSITVSEPLSISTAPTLPNGTEGASYSVTLEAAGGTPPYSWSFVSGAMPESVLFYSPSGLFSGTPGNSGTFTFKADVKDSASPPATLQGTFTVTINQK